MGKPVDRFFNDVTPLVYDLQLGAPDEDFWVALCREAGGPVLELGCGTGRMVLPLARAGLEVVGVDLSEPMLRVARSRLAEEPEEVRRRVRLRHGDMRERVPGAFGCAIIPVGTFTLLLTKEDQRRTVRAVHDALREGGLFVVHLPVSVDRGKRKAVQHDPVRCTSPDGTLDFSQQLSLAFDAKGYLGTKTTTYTFHRPAHLGTVVERMRFRTGSREEIEALLHEAGFMTEHVWGGNDRRPLEEDSRMMILAARRRETR
jgi:SAM-dependent methyltransferase